MAGQIPIIPGQGNASGFTWQPFNGAIHPNITRGLLTNAGLNPLAIGGYRGGGGMRDDLAGYSLGLRDDPANYRQYSALRDAQGNIVGEDNYFADFTSDDFIDKIAPALIMAGIGAGGFELAGLGGGAGGLTAAEAAAAADYAAIQAGATAGAQAGAVGGGTVAGTGINFGAGGAGSLYTPTGFAGGTGSAVGGATAGSAGGWTLGNTLSAAQLASGVIGSYVNGQAAGDAAAAQQAAAQQGITAQQQALAQITAQLAPYTAAGPGALKAQQDLAGLNGPQAQQAAIAALQASPQFTSQQQLGEERILANASATGGLRGGNVQAALAQFSPALLADTINQQYGRLGGLVQVGQNSAAGVGTATLGTANNTTNLLQQQGAAAAGGALAQGRQTAGYIGAITNAIGLYAGITGGF